MCCEIPECYVAVFDHGDALCYLKGEAAVMDGNYFENETGFTTYDIMDRGGAAAPYSG